MRLNYKSRPRRLVHSLLRVCRLTRTEFMPMWLSRIPIEIDRAENSLIRRPARLLAALDEQTCEIAKEFNVIPIRKHLNIVFEPQITVIESLKDTMVCGKGFDVQARYSRFTSRAEREEGCIAATMKIHDYVAERCSRHLTKDEVREVATCVFDEDF